MAGGADEFGDEGGVAAAGADLQDTVAGLDAGGFEHVGLQPGRGDGAGDAALVAVAGGDDVVGVRLVDRYFGCEGVPGHCAQGSVDRGGVDVSGSGELAGQLVAQGGGLVEVRGGGCRHGGPFGRAGHAGSATVGVVGWGRSRWGRTGLPGRRTSRRTGRGGDEFVVSALLDQPPLLRT